MSILSESDAALLVSHFFVAVAAAEESYSFTVNPIFFDGDVVVFAGRRFFWWFWFGVG